MVTNILKLFYMLFLLDRSANLHISKARERFSVFCGCFFPFFTELSSTTHVGVYNLYCTKAGRGKLRTSNWLIPAHRKRKEKTVRNRLDILWNKTVALSHGFQTMRLSWGLAWKVAIFRSQPRLSGSHRIDEEVDEILAGLQNSVGVSKMTAEHTPRSLAGVGPGR